MNIAVILAGGVGSRMELKDFPKQYLIVNDKPIIGYCLETFQKHNEIDAICIVADESWQAYLTNWMQQNGIDKFTAYALPGKTRQFSIYHALKELEHQFDKGDKVIIHDAARPFVSVNMITAGIRELDDADGVMPVLPVKDTFYCSTDRKNITALLPREQLFAGQAPEFFYLGSYLEVHKAMTKEEIEGINGSSEIAYKAGLSIHMIAGEEQNFKITTPDDMELMKMYLQERKD